MHGTIAEILSSSRYHAKTATSGARRAGCPISGQVGVQSLNGSNSFSPAMATANGRSMCCALCRPFDLAEGRVEAYRHVAATDIGADAGDFDPVLVGDHAAGTRVAATGTGPFNSNFCLFSAVNGRL